jgi:uncharacterized protein (TIGR03086 family)
MIDGTADPRPQLHAALDQTQRQVDAVQPHHLDRPTPCTEYDARLLLAHLVAVLRKLTIVRQGGDMTQVADPANDATADWAAAFRHARAELDQQWAAETTLSAGYTLAWGTMTGRELLDAYAHEFTVHAWDLARVTGCGEDLDPRLAEAALAWYSLNVPADNRAQPGPFAPAVPVAADADPYIRLAGFVGRPV